MKKLFTVLLSAAAVFLILLAGATILGIGWAGEQGRAFAHTDAAFYLLMAIGMMYFVGVLWEKK